MRVTWLNHTTSRCRFLSRNMCFGHMGVWPEARSMREKRREELPAIAAVATIAAVPATATATTTTIIAASATPIAPAASAAAPRSFRLRAGFVDYEVPATEVLTVEAVDSAIRIFIAGDFDEGEAARLACEAVTNETDCRRGDS